MTAVNSFIQFAAGRGYRQPRSLRCVTAPGFKLGQFEPAFAAGGGDLILRLPLPQHFVTYFIGIRAEFSDGIEFLLEHVIGMRAFVLLE